jgi:hypothetical protein
VKHDPKTDAPNFFSFARDYLHTYMPTIRGLSPRTIEAYRITPDGRSYRSRQQAYTRRVRSDQTGPMVCFRLDLFDGITPFGPLAGGGPADSLQNPALGTQPIGRTACIQPRTKEKLQTVFEHPPPPVARTQLPPDSRPPTSASTPAARTASG